MRRAGRVTPNDSCDRGFAFWCPTCCAIDRAAFIARTSRAIADVDAPLLHVRALGGAAGRFVVLRGRRHPVGRHPDWCPSTRESTAIDRIAYPRDRQHRFDATDRAAALRALRRSPGIGKRFARLFLDVALPVRPHRVVRL